MRGIGAGGRIFDILGRSPVIPHGQGKDVPANVEGVIRFEGVKFHYPTRKNVQILNNFNVEIKAGETVAIVWAHVSPP
jgi:ABC-type multidrug transport system fused ATPase/permease subunit